jgi:hypothetical protein
MKTQFDFVKALLLSILLGGGALTCQTPSLKPAHLSPSQDSDSLKGTTYLPND